MTDVEMMLNKVNAALSTLGSVRDTLRVAITNGRGVDEVVNGPSGAIDYKIEISNDIGAAIVRVYPDDVVNVIVHLPPVK